MNIISINNRLYNADLIFEITPVYEWVGRSGLTYTIRFLDNREVRIDCGTQRIGVDEGLHWNWRQDDPDADAINERLFQKAKESIESHRNQVYQLWSKSTTPYPSVNVKNVTSF